VTPRRTHNPLTLIGAGLTTASAVAFIAYYVVESMGFLENPYAGLIGFVLIPALFVLGLLLIPLGAWKESRRRRRGHGPWRWPVVNLGSPSTRRIVAAVALLTLVNLAIVAVAGFGAAHYMESTAFCGQVCHEPMKPQFTAHQVGAHANVKCVSCHVSPGASGTVKAKLAGTRQLYQVAVGNVPRPIHAEGRVPFAADTCVTCHRPGFTPRDTTKIIREYADDEANTETITTLDMLTTRIHWHARPDVRVQYAVSEKDPNVVTYVRATQGGGAATEYFGPGVSAPATNLRQMDCLSCHSRPAHTFAATAERTVDNAIGAGLINRSLPYVRREAVAALKAVYDTEAAAMAGISKRLTDFYAGNSRASAADVSGAIAQVQQLYRTNVFPEMKITWGTHVPQLGHMDAPGCFRCHTDEHKAAGGKVIKQDCESCHKQR
jgi:NapC/NirT cytochrome c family, N-terminal region